MPLPSPLEKLIDTIELKVQDTVNQYAPTCKSQVISRKKGLYRFGLYTPEFIDRNICPPISLNGECDNYKDSLDAVAIDLLQKYVIELQESQERIFFDTKFDGDRYESKINKIRKRRYGFAVATATIATAVGTSYFLSDFFDPQFAAEYIFGLMAGTVALVGESWVKPLGKLFMINYGKSKLLGTTQYKAELKQNCLKDVSAHLRKINPNNSILKYNSKLTTTCKN